MAREVAAGDVLAGKFRVERVVGRGGMGVVVEATNTQLDQKVALKLLARGGDDPAVVERFTHEAKAAARLRSEHVARVFDVGKDTAHGPFIVMEMLEGQTLADVIASAGRLPIHRAVEYTIDACEGLAEAHARSIVHQDVKPGNLFLVTGDDGRPTVKVLDFGIAAVRTEGTPKNDDGKSSAPRAQGTPAYLSPEQLRGAAVDHRADVWALGCVLYELVTATRPFRAERFTELVTKILEEAPEPLPADLEIPAALVEVITRCLEKDRTKRYASTGQLALALLPFARRRAHSSVSRAVAHVKSVGLDPHLEMPSSMPPPPAAADSDPAIAVPGSNPRLRAPSVPDFSAEARPTPAPRTEKSKKVPIAIALLFWLIATGGAVIALTRKAPPAEAVTDAASTPREVEPSAIAAPEPRVIAAPEPSVIAAPEPSETAAPPTTPTSATVEPTSLTAPAREVAPSPAPRARRPAPSASASAPRSDIDIRHSR